MPEGPTFGVSLAWARRLKQQRRERGDIIPRMGGGEQIPKVDPARLRDLVHQKPDATLAELRDSLNINCSLWTISKSLRRLKLTYKKSRSMPLNRTGRTSLKDARNGS